MATTSCHINDVYLIAPGDHNHADLIAKLNEDAGLNPNESDAYAADEVLILGGDGGREVVLWGSRDDVAQRLHELLSDLGTTDDNDDNDDAAACAPDLEVIDAAGAAGMVNDRLAAILPALQDAGFDIYISKSLRDCRTSYVHVGRLGCAGYLEASDLPGRRHGYLVSFPLKPSRAHGSGVGVWTDRADDDGIYVDATDVVDALKLACSPTTTPAICDTPLNNLTVAGLLRRHFPPTHILPAGRRNRKE